MPRPTRCKTCPEAQEAFKEGPETSTSVAARSEEWLKVWFADDTRSGHQGTSTQVWDRKGSRPRAVRQTEHV